MHTRARNQAEAADTPPMKTDHPLTHTFCSWMSCLEVPPLRGSEQSLSPCVALYRVGKTRYALGMRVC